MRRPKPRPPAERAEAAALDALAGSQGPTGVRLAASLLPAWQKNWLLGLLLVAGTIFAYQPAWHGGFIWDDETHLVHNPHLFEPDGLKRIWFSLEAPQYYPLVFTSFRLERPLWGLNPTGYHFVNLLLHTASALLLWQLLQRLNVRGAWLAAAVFALHPVNVESVAWITERKNTLSGFFFLLSLLLYLRFDELSKGQSLASGVSSQNPASSDPRHATRNTFHVSRFTFHPLLHPPPSLFYGLSLFSFVLALLSKTAVAPLPVVLMLIAWWERGRVTGRDVLRSMPFAMAAMVLIPLTVVFEHQAGAEVVRNDGFWSRLAGAGWGFWFYLYKAVLPLNLSFVYPRWRIDPANMFSYVPGLLVMLGFVVCWRCRQGWGKASLFALSYFLVMLLPTLGFVNIYFMRYAPVSDHWLYFAIIGPISLAMAALTQALGYWARGRPFLGPAVCGALVLALAVLTWRQSANYANVETLWRTTLARNPHASLAHHNLGVMLLGRGQVDQAWAHFQKALDGLPDFAEAHIGLANVLREKGRLDEAILHSRKALALRPDLMEAHTALAAALLSKGNVDEAIFRFQRVAQMRPDSAEIQNALGSALIQGAKVGEAGTHFQRALQLRPGFAEAHNNLGLVLLQRGKSDEAIAHFRQALIFQPTNAPAHSHLGQALLQQGHVQAAIDQYKAALAIQPEDVNTLNNLAWVLATCPEASSRNGARAVELAARAERLAGRGNLSILDTLAAAYAETGRFDEAISLAHKARQVAKAAGARKAEEESQKRLELYEAHRPCRESPASPTETSPGN